MFISAIRRHKVPASQTQGQHATQFAREKPKPPIASDPPQPSPSLQSIPYNAAPVAQLKKGDQAQGANNERWRRKQDKAYLRGLEEARQRRRFEGPERAPSGPPKLNDDIAPSYAVSPVGDDSPEGRSLTHRGLVETEHVKGKRYVRTYQTVYADAPPGGNFKDVHQVPHRDPAKRRVKFVGGNDAGTTERCFNFGNPLRALDFAQTYVGQKPKKVQEDLDKLPGPATNKQRAEIESRHGKPIIRSFLVPFETYDAITSNVASESNARRMGDYSKSVDKSRASDQYQLLDHHVKALQDSILPGSLQSHVMDNQFDAMKGNRRHGSVKKMSDLSSKLGVPDAFGPLAAPMSGAKLQKPGQLVERATQLGDLHDQTFALESMLLGRGKNKSKAGKKQFEAERANQTADFAQKLSELTSISDLPRNAAALKKLRNQLSSAANAALIPSLIKDDYTSVAESVKEDPSTGEAAKRGIEVKHLPTINVAPPPVAQVLPSEEEKQQRHDEREARRQAAQADDPIMGGDEDGGLFGGLF